MIKPIYIAVIALSPFAAFSILYIPVWILTCMFTWSIYPMNPGEWNEGGRAIFILFVGMGAVTMSGIWIEKDLD